MKEPKWRCARCGKFVPECGLYHADEAGQINICEKCAVLEHPPDPPARAPIPAAAEVAAPAGGLECLGGLAPGGHVLLNLPCRRAER